MWSFETRHPALDRSVKVIDGAGCSIPMTPALATIGLALLLCVHESSPRAIPGVDCTTSASSSAHTGSKTGEVGSPCFGTPTRKGQLLQQAGASSLNAAPRLLLPSVQGDQLRPMVKHWGKSSFRAPILRSSPTCQHARTRHGANQEVAWTKCQDRRAAEQATKLKPHQMVEWNNDYDCETPQARKEEKQQKKQEEEASAQMSSSQPRSKFIPKEAARKSAPPPPPPPTTAQVAGPTSPRPTSIGIQQRGRRRMCQTRGWCQDSDNPEPAWKETARMVELMMPMPDPAPVAPVICAQGTLFWQH